MSGAAVLCSILLLRVDWQKEAAMAHEAEVEHAGPVEQADVEQLLLGTPGSLQTPPHELSKEAIDPSACMYSCHLSCRLGNLCT
jgi:hypothetical protein